MAICKFVSHHVKNMAVMFILPWLLIPKIWNIKFSDFFNSFNFLRSYNCTFSYIAQLCTASGNSYSRSGCYVGQLIVYLDERKKLLLAVKMFG